MKIIELIYTQSDLPAAGTVIIFIVYTMWPKTIKNNT